MIYSQDRVLSTRKEKEKEIMSSGTGEFSYTICPLQLSFFQTPVTQAINLQAELQ